MDLGYRTALTSDGAFVLREAGSEDHSENQTDALDRFYLSFDLSL